MHLQYARDATGRINTGHIYDLLLQYLLRTYGSNIYFMNQVKLLINTTILVIKYTIACLSLLQYIILYGAGYIHLHGLVS